MPVPTFTPGPWRRGIGNDANKVFDAEGRIVADRVGYSDGNLIAAAPDLLAVVTRLIAFDWRTGEGAFGLYEAAAAAIAKAEGAA
jgi:hypothetical protein